MRKKRSAQTPASTRYASASTNVALTKYSCTVIFVLGPSLLVLLLLLLLLSVLDVMGSLAGLPPATTRAQASAKAATADAPMRSLKCLVEEFTEFVLSAIAKS